MLSPVNDVTNALSGNLHALLDGVRDKATATTLATKSTTEYQLLIYIKEHFIGRYQKLAEELTKLTVLEVNELKNVLKRYGIGAAAAAAVAVAAPAGDAGAAADEKSEFTVKLS